MDSPTDSVQTDFCIGAAAYPEHPDENERLEFFKLKVQNGAEYGITDLIYDANAYERFLELLDKGNCRVPILPGSRILTSQEQAERMMKRFPIQIPKPFFNALPSQNDPDAKARGVELFLELVEDLKRRGAPGIHLYVIGNLSGALKAVEGLKSQKKTRNQTQQFEANASV